MSWAERAADRSPVVQRSRERSIEQATTIVGAARRILLRNGGQLTTAELVQEAGVALQTFYRCFGGKDQLLLAVFEDVIGEACAQYRRQAADIGDPIERLRLYVTAVVRACRSDPWAQFVTSEHWRLFQRYPVEVARAANHYSELVRAEVIAASEAGLLRAADPDYNAWFVTQLVMAVYHHHAFSADEEPTDVIADRLWAFCLAALGGTAVS